jgi:predicted nucleic acid-binding protein
MWMSDFLLDTNVISEWTKPAPNPGVVRWLEEVDEDRVRVSVASFAEISHGVERLADSARGERLQSWLEQELPERFEGRILDIDRAVAERWGVVVAGAQRAGRGLSTMDAFFAATALQHGLALVTRNSAHFQDLGLTLLNPWSS